MLSSRTVPSSLRPAFCAALFMRHRSPRSFRKRVAPLGRVHRASCRARHRFTEKDLSRLGNAGHGEGNLVI